MTHPGDNDNEMAIIRMLDDETMDSLVEGDPVGPHLDSLASLADGLRMLGDEPLPPPSADLERVFAGGANGIAAGDGDEVARQRLRSRRAPTAGRGIAARIALTASVAAAGLAVAGASGVLPEVVGTPVRRAVEAVTPIELDDSGTDTPGDSGRSGDSNNGESFGDRVSDDATGESDGEPGVDGDVISDQAPGATNRPGQPGETGRDRADDTPGASHLPTQPTAPSNGGDGRGGDTPAATTPATTARGGSHP